MANECRIQFYFRAEDVKKLLDENPGAKGIIVSQSIKREKPKGAENYVNVAHIRARVHMPQPVEETQSAKLMEGGDEPPPEEGIDGCPFPPGCTP
ncbi:MAG: hypothetical protein V4539_18475 [Bacteroidota bacterium]